MRQQKTRQDTTRPDIHLALEDASPRCLALHFAQRLIVQRAVCVSLPLRSRKRPLRVHRHKPVGSQRLPRTQAAALLHGVTNPAISPAAHNAPYLPRKTMLKETPPHTIHHACHAKRPLPPQFPHTPCETTLSRLKSQAPPPATRNARTSLSQPRYPWRFYPHLEEPCAMHSGKYNK